MGKAFEKQIKIIEYQGEKQVKVLNTLKCDNNKLTIEGMIASVVVYPIGSGQFTVIMMFASSYPIRIDLFIDWLYEVLVVLYLLSIRVTS